MMPIDALFIHCREMKKILAVWLVVVLSIVVLSGCTKKQQQQASDQALEVVQQPTEDAVEKEPLRRYEIEAATIEYIYSGMQNGTEIFSFDQFGMREHKLSEFSMNIGGFSEETSTVSMFLGEDIINYDLETRQ
jgi:ABC-type cobalt transport system substrate-binding protein